MSDRSITELMREIRLRRVQQFNQNNLNQHLRRAEKLQLPATLTMEQWSAAIKYFDGKCAYCQEKPWELLEHFIPLGLGGGTIASNCVPSCKSCNNSKGPWHPHELPFYYCPGTQKVIEGIERVERYFQSLGSEAEA
jgi:5-methylcytosine-specific restriction endonuclease McrA